MMTNFQQLLVGKIEQLSQSLANPAQLLHQPSVNIHQPAQPQQRAQPQQQQPAAQPPADEAGEGDGGIDIGGILKRMTAPSVKEVSELFQYYVARSSAGHGTSPEANHWKAVKPRAMPASGKKVSIGVLETIINGLVVFDKAFIAALRSDSSELTGEQVVDFYVDVSVWVRETIRQTLALQSFSADVPEAEKDGQDIIRQMFDTTNPKSLDQVREQAAIKTELLNTALLRRKLEKSSNKSNKYGGGGKAEKPYYNNGNNNNGHRGGGSSGGHRGRGAGRGNHNNSGNGGSAPASGAPAGAQ